MCAEPCCVTARKCRVRAVNSRDRAVFERPAAARDRHHRGDHNCCTEPRPSRRSRRARTAFRPCLRCGPGTGVGKIRVWSRLIPTRPNATATLRIGRVVLDCASLGADPRRVAESALWWGLPATGSSVGSMDRRAPSRVRARSETVCTAWVLRSEPVCTRVKLSCAAMRSPALHSTLGRASCRWHQPMRSSCRAR